MRRYLAGLLAFMLLCGCGGSSQSAQPTTPPTPEEPPPEPPLFASNDWRDVLPEGAQAVMGVQVAQLFESKLFALLKGTMSPENAQRFEDMRQEAASCEFAFPGDVHTLVVGLYPSNQIGISTGKFDDAKLDACLSLMTKDAERPLQRKEIAGRNVYGDNSADGEIWVSAPVTNLAVITDKTEHMNTVLTRETARMAADTTGINDLVAALPGDKTLWFAAMFAPGAELTGQVQALAGGSPLSAMTALYGVVEMADVFAAEINVQMPSEADADALINQTKDQLAMLRMGLDTQGAGFLIDRLTLSSNGAVAQVQVALTPSDIDFIIEKLSPAVAPAPQAP